MPRGTTRSKKAQTTTTETDHGNGNSNVTVISAPLSLQDEIRIRAYLLYEQEGRQDGRDEEYWLRAESEVLEQSGRRRA